MNPVNYKPKHWFKSIHEARHDLDLRQEPSEVEYLCISSGETFIHTGGTEYWNLLEWNGLDIKGLLYTGISHYRVLKVG